MKDCDFKLFSSLLEYADCNFGYPCFDVYICDVLIGRVSSYGPDRWGCWGADGPYGLFVGIGSTKDAAVAVMIYLQINGKKGLKENWNG